MNWLKKALARRLRAKIALKSHYGISDAHSIYEFIKNRAPVKTSPGFVVDEAGSLYSDKNVTFLGNRDHQEESRGGISL